MANLDGIENRTVQLASGHLFYEAPFLKGSKKKNKIPKEYLEARLQYAIGRLREKIEVATSKHHSEKRPAIIEAMNAMHDEINSVIREIPDSGIESENPLVDICEKVREAVRRFKNMRDNNIAVVPFTTELIFRTESGAIRRIFSLSPKKEKRNLESTESPDDLAALNNLAAQLRDLQELTFQAPGIRTALAKERSRFDENIQLLSGSHTEIAALLKIFPDLDSIKPLPANVRKASQDAYQTYRNSVMILCKALMICMDLKLIVQEHAIDVEKTKSAIEYFRALVKFKNVPNIKTIFDEHAELIQNFDRTITETSNARSITRQFEEKMEKLLAIPGFRETTLHILEIMSPDDVAELNTIFEGILPTQKRTSTDTTNGYLAPIQGEATTTGPIPVLPDERGRHSPFRWKQESRERAQQEVRNRLSTIPLINSLIASSRWAELRFVLDRIQFTDLTRVGLSSACVGGGEKSLYPSKDEMFADVFPSAYADDLKSVVGSERGLEQKRFHWTRKGITQDEIRNEATRRITDGIPLLQELLTSARKEEARFLISKLSQTDLIQYCRLSSSCIGGEKAPYKTKEELLSAVFGELAPTTRQESSPVEEDGADQHTAF